MCPYVPLDTASNNNISHNALLTYADAAHIMQKWIQDVGLEGGINCRYVLQMRSVHLLPLSFLPIPFLFFLPLFLTPLFSASLPSTILPSLCTPLGPSPAQLGSFGGAL